jgi:hypothetical protein
MGYQADVGVFDRTGRLALVVEVKGRLGTTGAWAAKMRRNLVAHGVASGPEYFLLALPDRFYLWRGDGSAPEEIAPTYEIDPTKLVAPYRALAGLSTTSPSERGFEIIVEAWLDDLLSKDELPSELSAQEPWLPESGLFDALKGGRIEHEVAA